ncbi:nuclear transcription factor Y subunit beta isoform X1 [Mustela lutreola]|uniref:nuclear transcription factor Y subunit beta isoform X1 n=1 Tax=Mustela lutreola TaxID=9666 RepID=UPI0027970BE7|nr:nuclear transcription factor Y subunit beta isoform X1 [Mustela lutreola]XP_059042693.1 nuclear transcription factor Y subunit beta isoform X1 [Mustela lutreola]
MESCGPNNHLVGKSHISGHTRKTRGAEGIPGGSRHSNPPGSLSVALAGGFCPWFPLLKNRRAGETLSLGGGRGQQREGSLRNHASRRPGKTPWEENPQRPQERARVPALGSPRRAQRPLAAPRSLRRSRPLPATRSPQPTLQVLAAAAARHTRRRRGGAGRGRGRGRGRGGAGAGGHAGGAEGGCRAEGSGPRRREGRPSPGSGAPRWDWFLRSHFLSNQTADWRREPTRAALEVEVGRRLALLLERCS